jgi:hypothetical protein
VAQLKREFVLLKYTERSTGGQIVTPFSIIFFNCFHRHRNTYTFIVIIGVFIVCNVIICLLFFVVYTEEIGNLMPTFSFVYKIVVVKNILVTVTVKITSNRHLTVLSMQLKHLYDIQLHYAFLTSIILFEFSLAFTR